MIIEETISPFIFVEQRTYYIYKNEEDRKLDIPMIRTSDKTVFETYKKQFKKSKEQ